MTYRYPPDQRRRSTRLRAYDYANEGAYFVTLCTHGRECLFGDVHDGAMELNDLGRIVDEAWNETPLLRPNILLDRYQIMPNHLHAILVVFRRGVLPGIPVADDDIPLRSPSQTLGAIVRGFKGATKVRVNRQRRTPQAPVWQRNYHDRIIRDDEELNRIRRYIEQNPLQWETDENHPENIANS